MNFLGETSTTHFFFNQQANFWKNEKKRIIFITQIS